MADTSVISQLSPEMMKNLVEICEVFWVPTLIVGYLIGVVLFGAGLFTIAHGEKKMAGVVALVIASFLLNLKGFMNMVSMSVFATEAPDSIHYTPPAGNNALLVQLCITGVRLFGIIVLIRSLLYFKDYANQQEPQLLYRAFSFFFGSLLCINIVQFLSYLGSWIGGDITSIVEQLL